MTALDTEPGDGHTEGLSSTATGHQVPTAFERARSRLTGSNPLVGWAAAIGVAVFALLLRVHRLGSPNLVAFDETYYAKDAWSLLHFGYVKEYLKDADGNPKTDINSDIIHGHTTGIWDSDPSMVVHPEVGKWLIALGEKAFGMDPFGWRISAAVVGALMVLVMCRLARRLTGSTALGLVAGLLLSFDGLHFVLSRLALLDIFLAFFLLCGVACVVNDRDWHRARLASLVDGPIPRDGWGPVRPLLFRPWLLLGGVCFGLALGTKWTAIYPMAAFGLLVFVWSGGARKSFGVRWARLRAVLADGVPAFVQLVLVAGFVYIATWTGWLVHADDYEQAYSQSQYARFVDEGQSCDDGPVLDDNQWPTAKEPDASGPGELIQSLRSLWYYHQDVYTFHTHFLNCSTHHYESKPSGWLFINRPVGVAADTDIKPTDPGCDAPRGQLLLQAGAAHRDAGHLVGRRGRAAVRRGDVGGHPRLAVRRHHRRRPLHVAPVADVRRPADLLLLRDRDPAVPGARDHDGDGQADRAVTPAVDPKNHRRGGVRVVLRARPAQLRVVLPDPQQRAAHPRPVARPDLVLPLGLIHGICRTGARLTGAGCDNSSAG